MLMSGHLIQAVLVGRPFVYGLAYGGEAGVKYTLKCRWAESSVCSILEG
jgi:isopentenyl diphosphate isomerase/L-lactate dehydrogenase-like FMN-dependent dehydrogenase